VFLSAERKEGKMDTTATWRHDYHTVRKNRWVGAFLSFIIPGAGSMYAGYVNIGLLMLILTVAGYLVFIVPGVFLHLISILLGYDHVRRFNVESVKALKERRSVPGPDRP